MGGCSGADLFLASKLWQSQVSQVAGSERCRGQVTVQGAAAGQWSDLGHVFLLPWPQSASCEMGGGVEICSGIWSLYGSLGGGGGVGLARLLLTCPRGRCLGTKPIGLPGSTWLTGQGCQPGPMSHASWPVWCQSPFLGQCRSLFRVALPKTPNLELVDLASQAEWKACVCVCVCVCAHLLPCSAFVYARRIFLIGSS